MAKSSTAEVEDPKSSGDKSVPAVASGNALPDFLQTSMDQDAGLGLSQDAEDNVIPLLYILQTNSPQVDTRSPDHVKGAKPGDFWVKGSDVTYDGEEGIEVQPCFFSKDWVEWVPRNAGGGFVGKHDRLPEGAKERQDPESGKVKFYLESGNEINETRYHFVVFSGSPIVIPLTSTGHTASREWMNKMNAVRAADRRSVPSFACLWRLSTRQRQNKAGKWFALGTEYVGWVPSVADYEFGKALHEQIKSGELRAAAEDPDPAGGSGTIDHDPDTGEVKTSSKADPRNANKGDVPF